jgi:hypothetical protein
VGRFVRIETNLDKLIDDFADFRVDVTQRLTRLETQSVDESKAISKAVSTRSFKWMVAGIILSFGVGALTLVARLLGV